MADRHILYHLPVHDKYRPLPESRHRILCRSRPLAPDLWQRRQNETLEFVPPVILRTGIAFQKKRLNITGQFSYTARQFGDATNATTPSNNGINGEVAAYSVTDLTADYQLNTHFRFSASLNNLANQMYSTHRAESYPGPGIIPADGRSFYLTMQVNP